jgi:hypothetical protein
MKLDQNFWKYKKMGKGWMTLHFYLLNPDLRLIYIPNCTLPKFISEVSDNYYLFKYEMEDGTFDIITSLQRYKQLVYLTGKHDPFYTADGVKRTLGVRRSWNNLYHVSLLILVVVGIIMFFLF